MTDPTGSTPAEHHQEIELKYRVSDLAAGERLLDVATWGSADATGGRVRETRMEDRYVDTPEGDLERAGYAVRLRQGPDGTIVSAKSLARSVASDGAVTREELEGPADPVAPAGAWPPSDARSLVIEHAGEAALVERVTVRQRRRKRIARIGTTRVELSLDEVEVVAGGAVVGTFVELEAELVKGDEAALGAVATVFDAEPGLTRASTSKLETAMAIADGAPSLVPPAVTPDPAAPRLVVGKTPGVLPDDHVAEAGRKVMRFHLARMLAFEAGARSGEAMEDIHKMRVATRRQRAAWRVFGASFRPGRTKRYRDGLREIAARLGAVRDLDVLLEGADLYRADLPTTEQRALEPLLSAWRAHRDDARDLLIRELDSRRYQRWLDDYLDFVRTDGAAVLPVGPVQPHRVRDTAPSRIWAAYEQVRGYEPVLRWADVETLHELRIAGKWLRYSLEFVREALGTEADPLIAKVTALQDHLGLMNDADVTAGMARTFLVEHAGDLSPLESAAIGRYLVDREKETMRLRRTVGPAWRGVAGVRFRRGLGRVVAGL
ncbi:MAG: CHAD domain-containing protein [Candidatus Limnocylindrales bacterium]